MRSSSHILVVSGTKVRRPVFLLGAPHSGTDLLAHALKRSPGFHLTMGGRNVIKVVYAFARRPSIASDRGVGAARVLRDAYARGWQVGPASCRECPTACRDMAGVEPPETCADPRDVQRFADATPELLYSADVLLDAFPDAQFVQVIRDGRDAVAGMLTDERCLAWFRPGFANLDEVFPNPFLGVEEPLERTRWPNAARAVKCALRWRGSVRLSARLHAQTPEEQLHTVRYEDLVSEPERLLDEVSRFLGSTVSTTALPGTDGAGIWRERLTARQVTQVEKVAGSELHRLGYPLVTANRPSVSSSGTSSGKGRR